MSESSNYTREANILSALAHPTRLEVFHRAVAAGTDGITAGKLAEAVGVTPSNLSAHLSILTHSGLLKMTPSGRLRIFSAEMVEVARFARFFVEECCCDHPLMKR